MTRFAPWAVFLATFAVFAQTLGFDFLRSWDDGAMLLYNANLTEWHWRWMARSLYFGHWMPLTWLSWTFDAHLWGVWAGGWHGVNALLHATNAVLVFVLARRLLDHVGAAVLVALLFGVHPMRIESVAWITERKDVLSGLFVLLAVVAYLRYVDRGRRGWYALAILCGVLGVMSKSIAVLLPVILLALDWAILQRRALLEKIPFLVVSIVGADIAFFALEHGVHNQLPWRIAGLGPRLLHMAYSALYYASSTIWPSRLSYMIEYTWMPSWDQAQYPIAVIFCAAVAVFVAGYRRRWLTAAVAVYAVAILPQSGLFQNGPQLVANRYSYLACIPLMLLAGLAFREAWRRWPDASTVAAMSAVSALVFVTTVTLPHWKNDEALFLYAAESEPTCTTCQDWAAVYAYTRGDLRGARRYFERAIPVSATTAFPRYERYWGLAKVLDELGETEAAVTVLRVYLDSVPADYREYAYEQAHMQDAERRLARLTTHHP